MKVERRFIALQVVLTAALIFLAAFAFVGCDMMEDDDDDRDRRKETTVQAPAQPATAADISVLPNKSQVILTGNLIEDLGGKLYRFEDASGSVIVEIGSKVWGTLTFDPSDFVEITGKTDKSGRVEVKSIRKAEESVVQTPDGQTYYTVSFVILGGPETPQAHIVKRGEKTNEPVVRDATTNNIVTVDWYTDPQFTLPYDFNAPVTGDITLYGKH